jgi:lipopolysaccharide transport system permease protein
LGVIKQKDDQAVSQSLLTMAKPSRKVNRRNNLFYMRDLLRELIARDMKLRYRRSVLGLAWSLLNPLAELLVLTFVFTYVLPLNIASFPVFLYTGLLAWNWFRASLSSGANAIVNNRSLIRLPGFPIPILPVVTTASYFVHFVLSLPILVIFLILYHIPLSPAVIALPFVMAVEFLFILSLIYFLAAIQVTFWDTQYLLNIVLMLGFYLSPVFYDVNRIPVEYLPIYNLNPMVHIIGAYRAIFLEGVFPALSPLLIISGVSIILLWLGYTYFMRASFQFAQEL